MTRANTISASKELLLRFVIDNLEYRKRCLYLQEIISLGKQNQVWLKALLAFFDTPLHKISSATFSKN